MQRDGTRVHLFANLQLTLLALLVQLDTFRTSRGVTLTYENNQLRLWSAARGQITSLQHNFNEDTLGLQGNQSVYDDNGTVCKEKLLKQLKEIERLRAETKFGYSVSGRPKGRKPRMGICTTGQMGRFELTSKLENLVAINLERYIIDIVLVLAQSKRTNFANRKSDPGGRRQWTAESINSLIRERFRSHSQDVKVVVDDTAQEENPYVNLEYLKISNKPGLGRKRVQSHVRQWLALVRCWEHFSRLEREGPAYKVFIKIRDDSFVTKWLRIKESDYSKNVVISECLGFGGYNDKAAVLDAMYGETFFTRPIFDYYFHYDTLRISMGQPESLLRAVLSKHLVSVKPVRVDSMPIFTSRIETRSNASVCFVFDAYKIGRNPACWPKSCLLRQQLYCARCPTRGTLSINLTNYFGQDTDREPCQSPNHSYCKLFRQSLRRNQLH